MKAIIRNFLINLGALWVTSQMIPSLVINGGVKELFIGSLAFMAVNLLLVPVLKVLLLPLNLLTLGLFAWLSNVLALYFLVTALPYFKLLPYQFPGATLAGISLAAVDLSTFQLAIVVSFIIGFIIQFTNWIIK